MNLSRLSRVFLFFLFVLIWLSAVLPLQALAADSARAAVRTVYDNIVAATHHDTSARKAIRGVVSDEVFERLIDDYAIVVQLISCQADIVSQEQFGDDVLVRSEVKLLFRAGDSGDISEVMKDEALVRERDDGTWEITAIKRPRTPMGNPVSVSNPSHILGRFLRALKKKDWEGLTHYIPMHGLNEQRRAEQLAKYKARWSARDLRRYAPDWMESSINGNSATITYSLNYQFKDEMGNMISPDMKAVLIKEAGFWKVVDIVRKDGVVALEKVVKTCPEKMCRGNTLLYDGFMDDEAGECKYVTFECARGCDANTKACIKTDASLLGASFTAPQAMDGIILNGRHSIKVLGKASYAVTDTQNKGQHFPMQGVLLRGGAEAPLSALGLRLYSAVAGEGNVLSFKLASEKKMPLRFDLKGVSLKVWAKGLPDSSMLVPLVSPAPRTKSIEFSGDLKEGVWQDTRVAFKALAEDPDKNIESYTVIAAYGTIWAYDDFQEGVKEKKIYVSDWPDKNKTAMTLPFGWVAPSVSEYMQLDLVRDISGEVKAAIEQMGEDAIDAGLEQLYDKDALKALAKGKYKDASLAALKYSGGQFDTTGVINAVNVAENVAKGAAQAGETYAEVEMHTGEQAWKAGEAYEKGNEFYKEEVTARVLSILLDGPILRDGFTDAAATAAGVDVSLKEKLKGGAIKATVKSAQKALEYAADTYKAAGAKEIQKAYYIYLLVTDKDGYTDIYKVVVRVNGQESLI